MKRLPAMNALSSRSPPSLSHGQLHLQACSVCNPHRQILSAKLHIEAVARYACVEIDVQCFVTGAARCTLLQFGCHSCWLYSLAFQALRPGVISAMSDPIRDPRVRRHVQALLDMDWVGRHAAWSYMSCHYRRQNMAMKIAAVMSPSDLLKGTATGTPIDRDAVIPLPDRQMGGRQLQLFEMPAASRRRMQ